MLGPVRVIDEHLESRAARAAVGPGTIGPGTALLCLLLSFASFASFACGRVGFERLHGDGGARQGSDASADASGPFEGGVPDDAGPGEDSGPADAGPVVDGGALVACSPGEIRECNQGAANVFPTGMTSLTMFTGGHSDQWSSSCGGVGSPDSTLELTMEGRGTYRFEFDGGEAAAISIRDGDCAGPELACGLGAVEVTADRGQIVILHLEGAADATCIFGQLTIMGL